MDLGLHSGDLALPEAPSGSMLSPHFVKSSTLRPGLATDERKPVSCVARHLPGTLEIYLFPAAAEGTGCMDEWVNLGILGL